MTRGDLAKKTGIPEPSLKDLEIGKYKLSGDVAVKIALATAVHPKSLLNNSDPLLDLYGRPFSRNSPKVNYLAELPLFKGARRQLFEALWEVALDKRIGLLVSFSFEQWLLATVKTFGLETVLAEKLTDRLGNFDPAEIPAEFRPKSRKMAEEWEKFEEEIIREQVTLRSASPESRNAVEMFAIAAASRETAFEEAARQRKERSEAKPAVNARKQSRSTRQVA
jgi:hypothetical protein